MPMSMLETRQLDFSRHTARLREQIDAALQECVPAGGGCPVELGEAIRWSLLAPGKRLRPMLRTIDARQFCLVGRRKRFVRDTHHCEAHFATR